MPSFRLRQHLAMLLAVSLAVGCTPASSIATSPSATAGAASAATAMPSPTASLSKVQPQLPLPTYVRWATDQGSPDDTQRRSLLVLFYDSPAQGWRIVDAGGATVMQIPIAGSGMFGPGTCMANAMRPHEVATWGAIERPQLEQFTQNYRRYRAVAEGVPNGTVTLELVDSGCHNG